MFAALMYSPSFTTSRPHAICCPTTCFTPAGSVVLRDARCSSACTSSASSSGGRGRLPPCVQRMRSVERRIDSSCGGLCHHPPQAIDATSVLGRRDCRLSPIFCFFLFCFC